MKNPHFEKPQPKNPHQLTIWQHIMPNKSIARFGDAQGWVQLHRISEQQRLQLQSNNEIFCAKRVWNQKAEQSSISIETAFQKVADLIVTAQIDTLTKDMHFAVTEMYLLWRVRFLHASNPIADQKINMLSHERDLSKDEQERLEKGGVMFVDKDGRLAGRDLTGILLRRDMDIALHTGASNMEWGIIKSLPGLEFLCPDATLNEPIIPVSPNICLIAGWPDGTVTPVATGNINQTLLSEVKNYWFARDLAKCPIIKRTIINHQMQDHPIIGGIAALEH